ncbi:MAG TPA: glycosyltransferase family 87 protein [Thermoleophilaceae bacterium]|jgi:hypothetical protein
MIAIGAAGRVVLAFKTYGVPYDIDSAQAVRSALVDSPLHVYSAVNGDPLNHWPYPPGFFPLLAACGGLADLTGLAFHGWIQVPSIAADVAIAWLVQDHLGRRGAGERVRLAAAALVALGPSFWMISGYHGQIDSLAILPAVLALWLWERSPPGARRAVWAGLLIGVGTSIKSVPALMLVALLPSVRTRREAAALILPAVALPLLAYVPFLLADAHGTVHTLRTHRFLPGFGGISLLAQPELADSWLQHGGHRLSGVSRFLLDHEVPILALLMAPFALVVLIRRVPPTLAAAVLWSALVVCNPGFEFEFVVWALPFLLMAGWVWQTAVVQAVLLPPAAMLYWHPFGHAPTPLYAAIMIAAWCAAAAVVVYMGARLARRARPLARPGYM